MHLLNLTLQLLKLPPYLLLVFMIIFFAVICSVVTKIIRKYLRVKIQGSHNELTGYLFTVVAGFYALLLAFVVFEALDQYDSVERDADIEGSLAKSLYRQIKFYPDSAIAAGLKKDYINYVNLATEIEYPQMAKMKKSDTTTMAFQNVFEKIEKLMPADPNMQAKAQSMFDHLNDLSINRNLRMLAGNSEIPMMMWIVIFTGWLITLIFASLLHVENRRFHEFASGLMGAFLGLVFFLILILDHPFSGHLKIEPSGYNQILKLEYGSK